MFCFGKVFEDVGDGGFNGVGGVSVFVGDGNFGYGGLYVYIFVVDYVLEGVQVEDFGFQFVCEVGVFDGVVGCQFGIVVEVVRQQWC